MLYPSNSYLTKSRDKDTISISLMQSDTHQVHFHIIMSIPPKAKKRGKSIKKLYCSVLLSQVNTKLIH